MDMGGGEVPMDVNLAVWHCEFLVYKRYGLYDFLVCYVKAFSVMLS